MIDFLTYQKCLVRGLKMKDCIIVLIELSYCFKNYSVYVQKMNNQSMSSYHCIFTCDDRVLKEKVVRLISPHKAVETSTFKLRS